MAISRNGLLCGMNGQQERQWRESNGELLCHPTSNGLEHEERE